MCRVQDQMLLLRSGSISAHPCRIRRGGPQERDAAGRHKEESLNQRLAVSATVRVVLGQQRQHLGFKFGGNFFGGVEVVAGWRYNDTEDQVAVAVRQVF